MKIFHYLPLSFSRRKSQLTPLAEDCSGYTESSGIVPRYTEAAALGAALQALWRLLYARGKKPDIHTLAGQHVLIDGTGGSVPNMKAVRIYHEQFTQYRRYIDALKPLFK